MITIKTGEVLKNFKGENLKVGSTTEDLTVGIALSNILGGKVSNPSMGWQLGKKFATQEEVELKAEEVVFLKKEIGDNANRDGGYFAIVGGQVINLLESPKN